MAKLKQRLTAAQTARRERKLARRAVSATNAVVVGFVMNEAVAAAAEAAAIRAEIVSVRKSLTRGRRAAARRGMGYRPFLLMAQIVRHDGRNKQIVAAIQAAAPLAAERLEDLKFGFRYLFLTYGERIASLRKSLGEKLAQMRELVAKTVKKVKRFGEVVFATTPQVSYEEVAIPATPKRHPGRKAGINAVWTKFQRRCRRCDLAAMKAANRKMARAEKRWADREAALAALLGVADKVQTLVRLHLALSRGEAQ